MKKNFKMVAAFLLAMVMMVVSQEYTLAKVYDWSIIKIPGYTSVQTSVRIPYYKGEITYELGSLSGTCTLVVAECKSKLDDAHLYSMETIRLTKKDTKTFTMDFTAVGLLLQEDIVFNMCIDHNAKDNLINETLTATGTISY